MDGEGPAVTLLHGFSQIGASWDEIRARLPRGHRYIVPDLPGHGANAAARADMEGAGDALIALWNELGVERSHVIGYSLGGRLALDLATRHPQRLLSLAVIGAHAGLQDPALRRQRVEADLELAGLIRARGMEWFADYWAGLPLFAGQRELGPTWTARSRSWRLANNAPGLSASLAGMGQGSAPDRWSHLARIDAPTLIIAGAQDEIYSAHARRLVQLIPRARLALVAGAGHACHLERPEATARLLEDHLLHGSTR